MKKAFAVLSILAAFAVAAVLMPSQPAQAADVWKATLTSNDAGPSNTVALAPGVRYSLQCANPACYKTGTAASLAPDCSKDFVIDGRTTSAGTLTLQDAGVQTTADSRSPKFHQRDFESASDSKVAATALDGGDPSCQLYQVTYTPQKLQ